MARVGAALDRVQRRHPVLGLPIAVIYKFVEDQGAYLAAVIAFYGMLSLFPLLLLLSSGVGFVLQGDPELQNRIIEVAVQQVPTLSESFVRRQLTGSGVSLAIGVIAALFGGLGIGTAVQNAMNVVWDVPRMQRPNPILLRVRSLGLLLILLLFVLLTTALTQLSLMDWEWIPLDLATPVGYMLSFVITAFAFELVTKVAVRRRLTFTERLPGALFGAVLWQLLQTLGAAYVSRYVASSTIADGVFGSLLGVLVWVFLAGLSLVLALEFNVVLIDRLHPRSLAVVFADNIDLTDADMRVFERRAGAQKFKSYQRIDVDFDDRFEVGSQREAEKNQQTGAESRTGGPGATPGATRAEPPDEGPDGGAPGERTPDELRGTRGTGDESDVPRRAERGSRRRSHDASAP